MKNLVNNFRASIGKLLFLYNCVFSKRLLIFFIIFQSCNNKELSIQSPNGLLVTTISNNNNGLSYNLIYQGDTIITPSAIGFIGNQFDLSKNVQIIKTNKTFFNETWETINGKQKEVQNHYVELVLNCLTNKSPQVKFNLIVRCYDEGMAFRVEIPEQKELNEFSIGEEMTEVNLKGTYSFWATNGERPNLGPIDLFKYKSKNAKIQSPIVLKIKKEFIWQSMKVPYLNMLLLKLQKKLKEIQFK
jgi:hypothetical protein